MKSTSRSKLSLSGSSFSSTAKESQQANFILCGGTGEMKSSIIFSSCPEPILTLNFDGRDIPAFHRAQDEGVEIYRVPLRMSEDIDKLEPDRAKAVARKYLDAFNKEYDWAIEHSARGEVGTICIDTFGELKPILCGAILGRSEIAFKQIRAQGILNQMCREIVNKARRGKAHLAILARESEIYVNDKGTGKYKPKVPSALMEAVDWAGYLKVETKQRGKQIDLFPRITMVKCGGNLGELGRTYTPDDWEDDGPFAWICYNQWLKSEIEDWK